MEVLLADMDQVDTLQLMMVKGGTGAGRPEPSVVLVLLRYTMCAFIQVLMLVSVQLLSVFMFAVC